MLLIKLNHESLKIVDIIDEGRDVKTFLFDKAVRTVPGKFLLAGTKDGEKPFAISYERPLGITVKRIEKYPKKPEKGKFTNSAFELDTGDRMTITGPLGNGFPVYRFRKGTACLVGGGTGIAPLGLIPEKKYPSLKLITFLGAKTSEDLIMEDRFRGTELHVVTEDGSKGEKGLITQPIKKHFEEVKIDKKMKLYACGPEKMEYSVAMIAENFIDPENIYASLERLMRCGIGICGSCVCGDVRTCVNGPVMNYKVLKDNADFGHYKRDRFGIRELL